MTRLDVCFQAAENNREQHEVDGFDSQTETSKVNLKTRSRYLGVYK